MKTSRVMPCLPLLWGTLLYGALVQSAFAHAGDAFYHLRAGLDLNSFHYKEFDAQGNLLDREDGLLPGIEIGLDYHFGVYAILLTARHRDGAVDYDGQTQTGTLLTTITDTAITNYSARLKREISIDNYSASMVAELGEREWDREIQRTATTRSLYEFYRWPYYLIGGEATLWKREQFSVGVQTLVGQSYNSTLEVHMSGYETAMLDLKSGDIYLVSTPLLCRWRSDRALVIEPYFHYWHFDKSSSKPIHKNGAIVGQISEPENETFTVGVAISLQF